MLSCSKEVQVLYASSMALLCLVTEGVSSLDCYSCTYTGTSQCSSTVTCNAGEVCMKKVLKRDFLSTSYEKGCLDETICYSVQGLNTDRYCSNSPSDCTYCCSSAQCNQATTTLDKSATTVLSLIAIVFTVTAEFTTLLFESL